MNKTVGLLVGAVVGILAVSAISYSSMFGYNEAGQKHFVQTYFGDTKVVTTGGPFWYGNGLKEPYNNALRSIYTPTGRSCDYEESDGFMVQYADGGKGNICAQLDAMVPVGGTFQKLHQKYRSEAGLRTKLLDPSYRSLFTTTAELFTSTEAYQTKRTQIQYAIQDQLRDGAYVTEVKQREVETGVDETGNPIIQVQDYSVIKLDTNGNPLHQPNKFAEWDMQDIQLTITGYDFEPKTIAQIDDRRDAANKGETAQAEAKAAYWTGKKAEAEGEAARIQAQANAEVANAPAIANAKRDAELSVIQAKKVTQKAKEMTMAATERTKQKKQEALAALEEAKVITTLAKANAFKIQKEQEAGELKLRLDNSAKIAAHYAEAISSMNVPSTMIVGSGGEGKGSTEMQQLLQLQVLKSLKDNQTVVK